MIPFNRQRPQVRRAGTPCDRGRPLVLWGLGAILCGGGLIVGFRRRLARPALPDAYFQGQCQIPWVRRLGARRRLYDVMGGLARPIHESNISRGNPTIIVQNWPGRPASLVSPQLTSTKINVAPKGGWHFIRGRSNDHAGETDSPWSIRIFGVFFKISIPRQLKRADQHVKEGN